MHRFDSSSLVAIIPRASGRTRRAPQLAHGAALLLPASRFQQLTFECGVALLQFGALGLDDGVKLRLLGRDGRVEFRVLARHGIAECGALVLHGRLQRVDEIALTRAPRAAKLHANRSSPLRPPTWSTVAPRSHAARSTRVAATTFISEIDLAQEYLWLVGISEQIASSSLAWRRR